MVMVLARIMMIQRRRAREGGERQEVERGNGPRHFVVREIGGGVSGNGHHPHPPLLLRVMVMVQLRRHGAVEPIVSGRAGPPPLIAPQAGVVRVGIHTAHVTGVPVRVGVILESAVALGVVLWEVQG